ncbi:MAG: hypoxanthine phosphoribosyltransferase [Acidimicrobiales bacterium]
MTAQPDLGVDWPRDLVDASQIRQEVARLGREVSAAYPDGVVMVAVLKGAAMFLADLVRGISVSCQIDFIAISPYAPGTGRVRLLKDLDIDIVGKDVVLVEDIVDTGLTLSYLLEVLGRREPRSLEVCALLDKEVRRIVPTKLRFRGICIGDEFALGYGLDYAERYRNLDRIVVGDTVVLQADPQAYVSRLYGG